MKKVMVILACLPLIVCGMEQTTPPQQTNITAVQWYTKQYDAYKPHIHQARQFVINSGTYALTQKESFVRGSQIGLGVHAIRTTQSIYFKDGEIHLPVKPLALGIASLLIATGGQKNIAELFAQAGKNCQSQDSMYTEAEKFGGKCIAGSAGYFSTAAVIWLVKSLAS